MSLESIICVEWIIQFLTKFSSLLNYFTGIAMDFFIRLHSVFCEICIQWAWFLKLECFSWLNAVEHFAIVTDDLEMASVM